MGLSKWDSQLYMRFEEERTQPCRDLVHRILLEGPERIADLGCGPGNSTQVLSTRWPKARIIGVDSSPEMLRTARAAQPDRVWVLSDLRDWAPEVAYNLVFSNGALQWIPDHRKVVLRLFETVASGGALAFQVPARPAEGAGWVRALQMLHDRRAWRHLEWSDPVAIHVLRLEDYFDLLAPRARRVDLWDTEYHHILEGPSSVVDWTQATTLRPWLDQLSTEAERVRFLHDYSDAIGRLYAKRPEGHVIFPFLRRFVVAYR